MTETTWTAARMLPLAADWLAARFPGALLITEFVCGRAKDVRVDLAAITETEIVGVEIKAHSDNGQRLPVQGRAFSAVCRRSYLFCAPAALNRTLPHLPESWGDLRVMETAQGPLAAAVRDAQPSPCESAAALCSLLWRSELAEWARNGERDLPRTVSHARLVQRFAEAVPLKTLRERVCQMLRRRRWRTAIRRIGAQVLPPAEDEAA